MTAQGYGSHRKFVHIAECPSCTRFRDFPAGVLSEDHTVETRSCPEDDCDGRIETEPLFAVPPGEATHWFES